MCLVWFPIFIFLFKQKTAYEMRISDWSSDVCSSDLRPIRRRSRRRPSPTDWPACRYSMRSGVRPRRTARWSASILDAMSQPNSPAPDTSPLLTLDVDVEWLRNLAGTPLGERLLFAVSGRRFDGTRLTGPVLSWGRDRVTRTANTTTI